MKVDARDVEFSTGTQEVYAPKGLVLDKDGIWKATAKPTPTKPTISQEAIKAKAEGKSVEEFISSLDEGQAGVGSHIPYSPTKRLLEMNTGKDTLVEAGMKPDDIITVYRGVDNVKSYKSIQAGDYVATSRQLAKSYVGDEANVVSLKIKAKDFYTELFDGIENTVKKGIENAHLEGVYKSKTKPINQIPNSQTYTTKLR